MGYFNDLKGQMKSSEFKKRIITGAVYLLVIAGLIALKQLVGEYGALGFDVLFCAIAVIGSLEFTRACTSIAFPQKVVTVAYCSSVVPCFVLNEMLIGIGMAAVGFLTMFFVVALAILSAIPAFKCTVKGTLLSFLGMVYCGFLCCVLSLANHVELNSVAGILILFITVMLSDTFAYIIGNLFKKLLPYKLAPAISPNKTIVGGVGGIIGGIVGSIIAYYIFESFDTLVYTTSINGLGAFVLIGLILSIVGQAGDLFESGIKRKCNVKDMGNILPGHGGVLDRFDSLLFCGVIIALAFGVILV